MRLTPADVLKRAKAHRNAGVTYRLGAGGMNPDAPHPYDTIKGKRYCDCSGFVAYTLGISRDQSGKFYASWMALDVVTGMGKIAPIKAGVWGVDFSFVF